MQDDTTGESLPVLRLTAIANRFAKAEVAADAVHSNAAEPEDEFRTFYMNASNSNVVLQPPYNIRTLDRLAQENNALSPCIEAMVTNIDGTGFDFENKSDAAAAEDDSKVDALRDFFAEPWPGESFINMRKLLRRDMERTGNAYIEVIRDAKDQIQFIRHVDAKMMRLVVLDAAVPVPKTVRRTGQDVTINVQVRERRFVQLLHGTTLVYFKEFGASRDLDKKTGTWTEKGQRLPATARATEIIHLKVLPDAYTPYGVPRWISQLPSVLGSRKAEEFNLDFFDNGGVPPVLILLQGGTLQPEMKTALDLKMGLGSASSKNRVQVLEVVPNGGTFNSPNQVRVTIERFGCYSDDTEVLTENGWMLFKDWDGSRVASMCLDTGQLVFDHPVGGLQAYPYNGEMVHFTGAAHDALVTPNHKMVRRTYAGTWVRERADKMELRARAAVPVAPAYVVAGDKPGFDLAGRRFPATAFLKFLGLFIADGSTTTHQRGRSRVTVSVKKERKLDAILGWCDDLGVAGSFCDTSDGFHVWTVHDGDLASWLRSNVGHRALFKRIPREFLKLSTAQSQTLLRALLEGDAHHSSKGGRNSYTYSTVSKLLADDVQELALRCGWRATFGDDGRSCYYVSVVPGKNVASLSNSKTKALPAIAERVAYDGTVYCFEMPEHTIVTRRNGRVAIHGNSERQDDSMFENYDEKCEMRVRRSFRLPPIFVGQAQDYSFSTAIASYAVAEAQVFAPERSDFDEVISVSLLPALGFNDYKMVSKPLVIQDATVKLQGIQTAQGTGNVDPEDVIYEINEACGTSLKYKAKDEGGTLGDAGAVQLIASGRGTQEDHDLAMGGLMHGGAPLPSGSQGMAVKSDAASYVALRTLATLRKRDIEGLDAYVRLSKAFDTAAKRSFLNGIALGHFPDADPDIEGLGTLAEATLAVISQNGGTCGCGSHDGH